MKEAIFIKRISRFIVECELNKEKITAHLPNPGRLWELLIPGRKIYLKETKNRLNYRVFGIEKNKYFICLDTHYTNILVKKFIQQGTIRELKGYTIKKEEFKIGNSKIDFLLQKNKELLPLEVKSCTLFNDGIAMFPDAITERGKKHLEILEKNNGAIIFLVYCPDIRYFLPEFHIDPLFSEKLYRIKDKILIKAISVRWIKNEEFKFVKDIEIPWQIYEKEGKDKGSYLILGELKNSSILKIGNLNNLFFKKGFYIYIGSAMNYLSLRIKRHLRLKKSIRWHIDYLISNLFNLKAIPIRSSERIECLISNEISKIADNFIKNFGSSDCRCKSHLYFFEENPLENEKFIEIILKFRINRLNKFG